MVIIKNAKVKRIGNSYMVLIPKALVTCNVLEERTKNYDIEIKESPQIVVSNPSRKALKPSGGVFFSPEPIHYLAIKRIKSKAIIRK